jgi:hypothetical protein
MPRVTPHYLLTFYQAGDFYSASDDLDRVTVIDNQLESLSKIVGEGVLTGWTIAPSGPLAITVAPGSGFIGGVLHRTLTIKHANVNDNAVNSVLLQSRMFSGTGGFVLEVQGPFSGIASAIYLDSTAPAVPTNFSAVASAFDTVNLYWDANSESDFDHYQVQRDSNPAFPSPVLLGSPRTNGVFPNEPFLDEGLSSESSYYYRIRAVDRSGNASPYATHSGFPTPITTPADTRKPGDPTNLQLYPGDSQASLSFDPSPSDDVTKYVITVEKLDTDGSVLSSTEIDNGLSQTARVVPLTNAVTYRFRVQAVRHPGTSDVRSEGVVAQSIPQNLSSPSSPSSFSATPGIGSVTLSWVASSSPSGSAIGQKKNYRIRAVAPGEPASYPIDVGLVTTKKLSSYSEDTTVGRGATRSFVDDVVYLFKLTAADSFNNESGGVYAKGSTTDTTPPKDPRSLSGLAGDTVADLYWKHSQSTDVVSYDVYYDLGSGFVPAVGVDGRVGYVETYRVTGLPNGSPITFRVRAIDDADNISVGIDTVATPQRDTLPPAIPAFVRTSPGDESVSLTWAGVSDADLDHYVVKRSQIVGDLDANPNADLEIVPGSETERNVGLATTLVDPELENGKVYMYSVRSVDFRGNESDFSGRTLVSPSPGINEEGPEHIGAPQGISASYGSGSITVSWDFYDFGAVLVGPDWVFTVNANASPTAFNIYRSTSSLVGFELVASVGANKRSYDDSGLIGGTTYYYRVTAVRDNAEVIVDTGAVQPPNSILLGTVVANNGSIVSVTNSQRIVENIRATLTEETLSRLMVHRHLTKPLNSVTVATSASLSMVDIRGLGEIDLTALVLSDEAKTYYGTVGKDPSTGKDLVVDADTLYVISPNSVVNNVPFAADFQVLVNGIRPTSEFVFEEAMNAIRFSQPLKDADVVTLAGLGLTYYVPAKIDNRFYGFEVRVNGTLSADALVDEALQTVRFLSAKADADVVEVEIEPVVPDFGTQDGAKQVSISPDIVLNDFVAINDRTFVSESGIFEQGDVVFALVDGQKTDQKYYVDFENKSVIFDAALPVDSVVSLEVRNREEVDDVLDPRNLVGVDASAFKSGTFTRAQLPDISHEGRVRERAYPIFSALSSEDRYAYQAPQGTVGSATTTYAAYQTGKESKMGLLLGTSRGLLRSVRNVFIGKDDDASIVEETIGAQFEEGDSPVSVASSALKYSGRTEGVFPLANDDDTVLTSRTNPCLTEMADGRILLTGGTEPGGLASVISYVYDPTLGQWTQVADMSKPRLLHACALLPDGKVLVSGGEFQYFSGAIKARDEAEVYDPSANSWTEVGKMKSARSLHSLTVMDPQDPSSDVLAAGGRYYENEPPIYVPSGYAVATPVEMDTSERFSQSLSTWSYTGSLSLPVSGHQAFNDGKNVVVDGFQSRELYDSSTSLWTSSDPVRKRQSDIGVPELDGPTKQFFKDSTSALLAVTRNSIYESRDDGTNFLRMYGLTSVGVVHRVAESSAGTLFAATDLGVYEIASGLRSSSSWDQGGLIGAGTTETFDLQPVGTDMLAATEIGIYLTSDDGTTWTQLAEFDDVYNIEKLSDGTLFAQVGDAIYRSSDNGVNWQFASRQSFLGTGTLMLAMGMELFLGTSSGLYRTVDGLNFSLLDFDRNVNPRRNNVHSISSVGDDVYVGFDNSLYLVDVALDVVLVAEFSGTIPTVRVNGEEARSAFRYDTLNGTIVFERKTLSDDVVELASNYSLYQFSGGGWYAQNPNAVVRVFVNRAEQSGEGISTDARLGQFVFDKSLDKSDVVTSSVSGTSLRNEGELFHVELEDKMEMEKGLPLSLGRSNTANLLQLGLGIEHNFLERGLDRNQYYCLTGSYVDRSFNSFWDKSEFYIAGRREYDVFNSTVDYSTESKEEGIGTSALVPIDAMERTSQELWVGTDDGLFILNPSASFSVSEVVAVGDHAAVRHLLEFGGNVWASTNQGLFVVSDGVGGKVAEKNPGDGLPRSIYAAASLNNMVVAGTEDTIYYSSSLLEPKFGVWFRAVFTELRQTAEIEVSGTCNAILSKDGMAVGSMGGSLFTSTDGKVWELAFKFDPDLGIKITSLAVFAEMLFVGTNKGIYNDRGTAKTDTVALTLEKIEPDEEASKVHVNDLFAGPNELYMVGNIDQVYARRNESWTKTRLPVVAAHSFVFTSGRRKVALSNNQVFVE